MINIREQYWAYPMPVNAEGAEIRGEHPGRPYQLLSFYGEADAVDLPPGSWQIVCTSKEKEHKIPNGIVECKIIEYDGKIQGTRFVNYLNPNQRTWFINKPDSLHSLLTSKGCDLNKHFLIIKKTV